VVAGQTRHRAVAGETALGRSIQKADAFPGKGNTLKQLQGQGVQVLPKLITAHDHTVTFAKGVTAEITTGIWAIGYRDDSVWVKVPEVKDARSIAAIFVGVATAAITGPAWLLVLGLAGHALKDLWQHRRQHVAGTRWWAPFCCTVDLVAAALITLAILEGML
jgi:hypothetical protein